MNYESRATLITESEDYSKYALSIYRSLGQVYFLDKLGNREKEKILWRTTVLVIRLSYKIDKSWFDKMPNLKVIATPTTGLNHIDLEEAKERGIKIISLRGRTGFLKNITSTAEETWALILALVRKIPWAYDDVRKNKGWNRDEFKGHQLFGKTFGIVGFGRLGNIVARYAKAFGMNVIFYDPYKKDKLGVKKVSLDKLFKISDIISIHALYIPEETRALIKEKHFKLMKPSAYFINTARGEIIDENALLDALKNKKITGAALDVLANESQDGRHLNSDLGNLIHNYAVKHSNLIIVPHLGGATYEAMQVTEDFVADLVAKYFKKNK